MAPLTRILALSSCLLFPACEPTIEEGAAPAASPAAEKESVSADKMHGMSVEYLAKVRVRLITSHGEMVVSFRPDKAPATVANFVKLARDGFYDNTQFHRVMEGFMIQGGCPNTKPGVVGMPGTGNPGDLIDAEISDLLHERGVISMARGQDLNSAGCQFFIVHQRGPGAQGLDGKYTAFGKLLSGLETVDRIAGVRKQPGGEGSTPMQPVHLHQAIVIEG
ncbi:MAG: peptidylprolyl isomerase [Planctomycetota bacterium]|jgi:peptidyl-prolyl cis-trans isomerase B (cyclophilin B)